MAQPGPTFSSYRDLSIPNEVLASKGKPADISKVVSWLNRQVSLLYDHRRAFLLQHNQSLPIFKFPAEIFSMIFRHLTPPFWFGDGQSWLIFTHVCCAWRDIALADPRLWTYPLFEYPELARTMIERAGSLPLNIVLEAEEESRVPAEGLWALWSAFREHDTRRITLQTSHASWHSLLLNLASRHCGTAPKLEYLRVETWGAQRIEETTQVHSHILAPKLRLLELSNVVFPLQLQSLLHLRTMNITVDREVRHRCPTVCLNTSTILRLMEAAPNLEDVRLHNALISLDPNITFTSLNGPLRQSALVTMSRLHSLMITDQMKVIHDLLSRLSMPSIWLLQIRSSLDNECSPLFDMTDFGLATPAQSNSILHEFSRIIKNAPCQSPQQLQISTTYESRKLRGTTSLVHHEITMVTNPESHPTIPTTRKLYAQLAVSLKQDNNARFIKYAREILPLDNITSLVMFVGPETTRSFEDKSIWEAYSSLSSIEHITAHGTLRANALLSVLHEDLCSNLDMGMLNQNHIMPFPHITSVNFEHADITSAFLHALAHVLSHRRTASGIPIPSLTFVFCAFKDTTIELLWELLPDADVEQKGSSTSYPCGSRILHLEAVP